MQEMFFEVEGLERLEVVGETHIVRALEFVDSEGGSSFGILSASEQEFIQTACEGEGFIIETRRGSSEQHFKAVRIEDSSDEKFTRYEVERAFLAFYRGESVPEFMSWDRVDA